MFLGREISTGEWKEWQLQAYIVQEARRIGLMIEGDQNAAKRGYGAANIAKACGMTAGSPDIRIFREGGILILIEVKTKKGKLSDAQKKWSEEVAKRGFTVHVLYAENPKEAWEKAQEIINGYNITI